MATILDQTIARAVKLKYIPAAQAESVKSRIMQMSSKYGFSPDDFAMFSFIESDGMNPRAWNSRSECAGIIQFCSFGGAKTVGYPNAADILNLSVLQQLDLTDKYFDALGLKKGADLAELYLTVLNPASTAIKDPDKDLGVPGQQAPILYNSNGVITRNSINKAIRELTAQKLNTSVAGLPASTAAVPGDYNQPNSQLGSAISAIKSGLFSGENCPPPPYTQQARIIYTGCKNIISSASFSGGMGMGYAAPGIAAIGNSPSSLSSSPYSGTLNPGGFIKPCAGVLVSPFGPRWGKLHAGQDIGNKQGTPVYASAEGIVKYTVTGCTQRNRGAGTGDECGGGGYGNQVGITHAGGFFTLYAHLTDVLVKSGESVKQGQQVGTIGSTGGSEADHLHWEIRKGGERGTPLDPANYVKS